MVRICESTGTATRNDTILDYDGVAYILDFGKHAGNKLNEVPSDYVSWLISAGVHHKRPDLAAALHEAGLLSNRPRLDVGILTWRAPLSHMPQDSRFHDPSDIRIALDLRR